MQRSAPYAVLSSASRRYFASEAQDSVWWRRGHRSHPAPPDFRIYRAKPPFAIVSALPLTKPV